MKRGYARSSQQGFGESVHSRRQADLFFADLMGIPRRRRPPAGQPAIDVGRPRPVETVPVEGVPFETATIEDAAPEALYEAAPEALVEAAPERAEDEHAECACSKPANPDRSEAMETVPQLGEADDDPP